MSTTKHNLNSLNCKGAFEGQKQEKQIFIQQLQGIWIPLTANGLLSDGVRTN